LAPSLASLERQAMLVDVRSVLNMILEDTRSDLFDDDDEAAAGDGGDDIDEDEEKKHKQEERKQ